MTDIYNKNTDIETLMKGVALAHNKVDEIIDELMLGVLEADVNIKLESGDLSHHMMNILDNVNNRDELESVLSKLGDITRRHKLIKDDLEVVAGIINRSCKKVIGRRWTKAISAACDEFMTSAIEIFLAGDSNDSEQKILVESEESKSIPVIKLESVQDIRRSSELKKEITSLLENAVKIDIDGSGVERIDGSAMQLLYALFIYARQNNVAINWIRPSESLIEAARVLGMQGSLELEFN